MKTTKHSMPLATSLCLLSYYSLHLAGCATPPWGVTLHNGGGTGSATQMGTGTATGAWWYSNEYDGQGNMTQSDSGYVVTDSSGDTSNLGENDITGYSEDYENFYS